MTVVRTTPVLPIHLLGLHRIVCSLFVLNDTQDAFMDNSANTSTVQQLKDKLMQTLKDRADLVKENVELDKQNADLSQVRA